MVLATLESRWLLYNQSNWFRHNQILQSELTQLLTQDIGDIYSCPDWPEDATAPLFALAIIEEVIRTFSREKTISTLKIVTRRLESIFNRMCMCRARTRHYALDEISARG